MGLAEKRYIVTLYDRDTMAYVGHRPFKEAKDARAYAQYLARDNDHTVRLTAEVWNDRGCILRISDLRLFR